MIINREVLEEKLENVISAYAKDRKVVQKVTKELSQRNILSGDVLSIFKLNTPLLSLSSSFLYCFTKTLFNATQEHNINPAKYFTALEIETSEKWTQETTKETDKYPVVFTNAVKIQDNVWLTKISAKDLINMFSQGVLTYNPETQRPLKRKEINDKIIERIDVNPKAVNKIKDLILTNRFIPNCITINVLQDSDAQLEENSKEQQVVVYSGNINLSDGFHRYRGIAKALLENPTLEYTSGVLLTHFDMEKAKDYIYQEQQHNPINKEYTKTLNPDKMANQVVDKINEKKDSLLKGKITKDVIMIKMKKALVPYNVLADTIELTFNPDDTKSIVKTNTTLINGLNTIIEFNDSLLDSAVNIKYWVTYTCLIYCASKTNQDELSMDISEIYQEVLSKINFEQIEIKTINKNVIKHIVAMINSILTSIINNNTTKEGDLNE
jgi:hypothetical protein